MRLRNTRAGFKGRTEWQTWHPLSSAKNVARRLGIPTMQRLGYISPMNAEIHTALNYIHLSSIEAAHKFSPISSEARHQTRNRHRPEDFIPVCFVDAIIDHQLVIAFG